MVYCLFGELALKCFSSENWIFFLLFKDLARFVLSVFLRQIMFFFLFIIYWAQACMHPFQKRLHFNKIPEFIVFIVKLNMIEVFFFLQKDKKKKCFISFCVTIEYFVCIRLLLTHSVTLMISQRSLCFIAYAAIFQQNKRNFCIIKICKWIWIKYLGENRLNTGHYLLFLFSISSLRNPLCSIKK